MLPFLLFLTLIWSVTRADLVALPWAAGVGSPHRQTCTLSYAVLISCPRRRMGCSACLSSFRRRVAGSTGCGLCSAGRAGRLSAYRGWGLGAVLAAAPWIEQFASAEGSGNSPGCCRAREIRHPAPPATHAACAWSHLSWCCRRGGSGRRWRTRGTGCSTRSPPPRSDSPSGGFRCRRFGLLCRLARRVRAGRAGGETRVAVRRGAHGIGRTGGRPGHGQEDPDRVLRHRCPSALLVVAARRVHDLRGRGDAPAEADGRAHESSVSGLGRRDRHSRHRRGQPFSSPHSAPELAQPEGSVDGASSDSGWACSRARARCSWTASSPGSPITSDPRWSWSELQRRGIPFVARSAGLVRHLGSDRRFTGHNARAALFVRTGAASASSPGASKGRPPPSS